MDTGDDDGVVLQPKDLEAALHPARESDLMDPDSPLRGSADAPPGPPPPVLKLDDDGGSLLTAEEYEGSSFEEDVAEAPSEQTVSDRIKDEARAKQAEADECAKHAGEVGQFVLEKREELEVEICVVSARGLRAADIGLLKKGKSDPYVTGFLAKRDAKDEKFGATSVKGQTLDPVWGPDCLSFALDLGDESFEGVKLSVFDQDIVGFDDPLGIVLLSKDELLEPRIRPFEKELRPHPKSSAELQKKTTGFLTVRVHLRARVGIFVDSARHLHSADGAMGASDPYAVAKWLGHRARKLTRTKTRDETLSPTLKRC